MKFVENIMVTQIEMLLLKITNTCRVMSGAELKRDKVIVNACSCPLDILREAGGCALDSYHRELNFTDYLVNTYTLV